MFRDYVLSAKSFSSWKNFEKEVLILSWHGFPVYCFAAPNIAEDVDIR